METRRNTLAAVCFALALLLTGLCHAGSEYFVSILPQRYFVERLAAPDAAVHVLVPPGASPATYEVTPRQIDALGRAALFFKIGAPFEKNLLPKISRAYPNLSVVDTCAGIPLREVEEGHAACSHGEGGHDHGSGKDPHVWLDPLIVKAQASLIAKALGETNPVEQAAIAKRLERFHAELDQLHEALGERLARAKGQTMFVYHPSYGYFADRYGLTQYALEQAGKEPSLRHLHELTERIKESGVRALFVQPQFTSRQVEAIARETGAQVVQLDPLAYNYPENMRDMAEAVAKAVSPLAE